MEGHLVGSMSAGNEAKAAKQIEEITSMLRNAGFTVRWAEPVDMAFRMVFWVETKDAEWLDDRSPDPRTLGADWVLRQILPKDDGKKAK